MAYIIIVQRGDLVGTYGPYETEQQAADAAQALAVSDDGHELIVRVCPLQEAEALAAPAEALADIAVIIWTDSSIYGNDQMERAEAVKCRPVRGVSCGLVVSEGDDYITLALDHFEGKAYRCINSYNKRQIEQIIRRNIEPEE